MPSKLPIGTKYCQCSVCERYFGAVRGFDMHRVDGKCVDPALLLSKAGRSRLTLNPKGYWVQPSSGWHKQQEVK